MRVLAILPGVDKRFSDNAHALIQLKRLGVDLVVIASKMSALKTRQMSPDFENMDGIPIYRLYRNFSEQSSCPIKHYDQVSAIARRFKPDLIFCSQQRNMQLAMRLKTDFNAPIVLLVEFANESTILLGNRRYYLGIKRLARPIAWFYWRWLCNMSDAVITCNPADREHLKALTVKGKPVYFSGWCNEIPEGVNRSSLIRHKSRGIYAGSLQKQSFKNSEEFLSTIPLILEHTPTKEFIIVGNGSLSKAIEAMARQWHGQLRYIKELTRKEVWELIATSYYAYTPVQLGGWGFIGDAWTARTPLVVTHNGYEFTDRKDALIVASPTEIHSCINQLFVDEQLYTTLQTEAYHRYEEFHTASQVAKNYFQVFKNCLSTFK